MNSLLKYQKMCKSFDGIGALSDVSLGVRSYELVYITGEHSSGKTVLLKLAAGLLRPDSGELSVCDMPISKKTKRLVSYLPENGLPNDNERVYNVIKLFSKFYGDFDKYAAYEMLYDLNIDPDTRTSALSFGTSKIVHTALTLSRKTRLYLLDCPFCDADELSRKYFIEKLAAMKKNDCAIVLTDRYNDGDIAAIADQALTLWNGFITDDGGVSLC